MSIKEEIIEKTIIVKDFTENDKRKSDTVDKKEKKGWFFKRLKRKYRILITILFCLSFILIFMLLPMVIAAITQGVWW